MLSLQYCLYNKTIDCGNNGHPISLSLKKALGGTLAAPNVLAPVDFTLNHFCPSLSHYWTQGCHSYLHEFDDTHYIILYHFFLFIIAHDYHLQSVPPWIGYCMARIRISSSLCRTLQGNLSLHSPLFKYSLWIKPRIVCIDQRIFNCHKCCHFFKCSTSHSQPSPT